MYGKSELTEESTNVILGNISPNGVPKVERIYRMQNPLASALYVLSASPYLDIRNHDSIREVEKYVLSQWHDGHFSLPPRWYLKLSLNPKDYAYIFYVLQKEPQLELTAGFLRTFIEDLRYSIQSEKIKKSSEFLLRTPFRFYKPLGPVPSLPAIGLGIVYATLLANPSLTLATLANTSPHLARILEYVSKNPSNVVSQHIGETIELARINKALASR